MEIWKDVEGFERFYQVSNKGRVKSLERTTSHGHRLSERILKHALTGNSGYPFVGLCKGNTRLLRTIHRLVADAFIINEDNKREVNHIDCNKLNNNVENLEWTTPRENMIHARVNGKLENAGSQRKIILKHIVSGLILIFEKMIYFTRFFSLKRHWIYQQSNKSNSFKYQDWTVTVCGK